MSNTRRAPHEDRLHQVYILRNADEDVLYVGVTSNLKNRLRAHSRIKPWWSEVSPERTTTSEPIAWELALTSEEHYIRTLSPRYNRRQTNGSLYLRWGVRDEINAERAEYRAGLAARKAQIAMQADARIEPRSGRSKAAQSRKPA